MLSSLVRTPSHGELPWALLQEKAKWRTGDFDLETVWNAHLEAIATASQEHKIETVLFSSEDFSLLGGTPGMLEELHDLVKEHDVWILASVRPPQDYIISWYRHVIRTGKVDAGPSELNKIAPWKSVEFSRRVQRWADLFGKDRIILHHYGADTVKSYTGILGVPLSPDYVENRVNLPPHPWAIDAYRMLPKENKFNRARRQLLMLSKHGPKVDMVKAMRLSPSFVERTEKYQVEMEECLKEFPQRFLYPVTD